MRRLILIGGAAPAGLLAGLLAWLAAGGASANLDAITALEARALALNPSPPAARSGAYASLDPATTQLFAPTTGPGAIREPAIRVDGVSITRRRVAALISIDGKPADWLNRGESRDGVTLTAVSATKVTVETELGPKDLNLGDQVASSVPPAGATPQAPSLNLGDTPPPGVKLPPPPADAPVR